MKQYEAVIQTMEHLGGVATLGQLNQEVFKIKDCIWKTKTPFASIRRIVQTDKNIYKIKPGLYGLISYRDQLEKNGIIVETEHNHTSNEFLEFTHAYYQGLLLVVGKLKQMHTYIPAQDKNKKFYDGQRLGDMATMNTLPSFSYEKMVHKTSTIDVVWLNERVMPHSLFEVEHSTNMQNSLLKFNDLQDFYTRMIIVADAKREAEYLTKIQCSAFDYLRKYHRVEFLDYESLIRQYEKFVEEQTFQLIL